MANWFANVIIFAMESFKLMEPVLLIPKLEICDILNVEINEDRHTEQSNVNCNGNESHSYAINEQIDTTDPNASLTESNTTENRILFENYFCIISKERNGITAVCNFCKDTKGLRGCTTNNLRFVKHLEVGTLCRIVTVNEFYRCETFQRNLCFY